MNTRKQTACTIKVGTIIWFLYLAAMIAYSAEPPPERLSDIYARMVATGTPPPPYATPTPITTPTPDRFCQSIISP